MTTKTIYLSFDLSDEEFKIYKNYYENIDTQIKLMLHQIIKDKERLNKILDIKK